MTTMLFDMKFQKFIKKWRLNHGYHSLKALNLVKNNLGNYLRRLTIQLTFFSDLLLLILSARRRSTRLLEKKLSRTVRQKNVKSSHGKGGKSTPPYLLDHFKELAKRSSTTPTSRPETPKRSSTRKSRTHVSSSNLQGSYSAISLENRKGGHRNSKGKHSAALWVISVWFE